MAKKRLVQSSRMNQMFLLDRLDLKLMLVDKLNLATYLHQQVQLTDEIPVFTGMTVSLSSRQRRINLANVGILEIPDQVGNDTNPLQFSLTKGDIFVIPPRRINLNSTGNLYLNSFFAKLA